MAAPTFLGVVVGGSGASTSRSVSAPEERSAGDWLSTTLYVYDETKVVPTPDGWTPVRRSDASTFALITYQRVADGTDADDFEASWSGSVYSHAAMIWGSGSAPEVIDVVSTSGAGTGTTATAPSMTTTVDECLAIYVWGTDNPATLTAPSGFTKQLESGSLGVGYATTTVATAGPTGDAVGTFTSGSEIWAAHQFAIAPAPDPPVAVTGAASAADHDSAVLNGTVDPNGEATSHYFEYGTTTSYGTSVPVGQDGDAGSGDSPVAVAEAISGLDPETTYHYRLVAVSAGGTDEGDDETFITTPQPPETTIVDQNLAAVAGEPSSFQFESDIGTATFEAQLDDGPWEPVTSPHQVIIGPGSHVFRVRAINAGVPDPTPATVSWDVGDGEIASTRPAASPYAEELYEAMGAWTDLDEENGWPVLHACIAVAKSADQWDPIVRPEVDDRGPWETILDVDHTPAPFLPWLAQWVGVDPATLDGLDEASQRETIKATTGFRRGSPAAVVAAPKPLLTGNRLVRLWERDGGAYRFTVITYEAESPDDLIEFTGQVAPLVFVEGKYSPSVLRRLIAQKPAGLRMTYRVDPGWAILDLEDTYDGQTIADLEAAFGSIGDLESNLPT